MKSRWFAVLLTVSFLAAMCMSQSLQAPRVLEDPDWVKADAHKKLVYAIPGMDRVVVKRDLVYKRVGQKELKADVYRPTAVNGPKLPTVIFIHGGFLPSNLLTEPKDWKMYESYGRLAAASGMVGVTFNHRLYESWESAPNAVGDLGDLISYLREHAEHLGIDRDRFALWSFSGGGPLLSLAMREPLPYVRCLVSYYSLLDLQKEAAKWRGHLSEQELLSVSPFHLLDVNGNIIPPMFIARMGHDHPGINEAVDRFVPLALAKNLNLTVVNDPEGHHGFDIEDDTDLSREIIRLTLEFVKAHD